jgi:hypothetical protein
MRNMIRENIGYLLFYIATGGSAMYKNVIAPVVISLVLSSCVTICSADVISEYTELSQESCKLMPASDELEVGDELLCSGPGGYELLVYYGDGRASATVITPGGVQHDLNYWDVITRRFSSVGPRAEWRIGKLDNGAQPHAMIMRVNAYEDPERPEKITSYLAVVKITEDDICVTHRIRATGTENIEAREAADASEMKECLAVLP